MRSFTIAAIVLAATAAAQAAQAKDPLRVHLPQTVTVQDAALRLGSVCVVVSQDEALSQQANQLAMGRAPNPGEQIVLDRNTILSRLSSNGIPASRVQLSGSEQVSVQRDEQIFSPDQLLEAAEAFLAANRPGPAGCGWRLVRRPTQLISPRSPSLRLESRLLEDQSLGLLRVEVRAMEGDQPLGSQTVDFKLSYPIKRAVALVDILPGQRIEEQHVRIEDAMSDQPAEPDWASPVGMVANCRITRESIIRPGAIARMQDEVLVRRNEAVMLRIDGPTFVLTSSGICLQDGRCGEVVRVRNADSQRVVTGRVMPDATIRPVFEEASQ